MPLSRALPMPEKGSVEIDRRAASAHAALRPRTRLSSVFNQPLVPVVTLVVVSALVLGTLILGRSSNGLAVVWLPGAVATAVWLRSGRGRIFDLAFGALMAIGIFAGELLGGHKTASAFMLTGVCMIEIVSAVFLARRFAPGQRVNGLWPVFRLIASTCLVAPLIGAIFGGWLISSLKGTPLITAFELWWFGHVLGMVLLVPLIMSINAPSLKVFDQPVKVAEWIGLVGLVGALCYLIYFHTRLPIGFLINPMMIVVAVRLRVPGVAIAMIVVSLCALGALLHPHLPSEVPIALRLMNTQLMLIFACLTYLLVTALLNERDQLSASAKAGQSRAERASEAKSRLLANVAHEIKSPVGGVIGIGDLWASGQLGPVTPTQREMAEMLVKTARQVEALAHDLLDVARAESGAVKIDARPTDVLGLIEDVRRSTALRPEAKALRLEIESDGGHFMALADSQRLTQVVDNLATNAVKYGGVGGVVTFRVLRIAEGVRVEVVDRGPGLSNPMQAQLFEPFNRLGLERTTVEGHGIGLALAKRLVELQGGTIGVISAPGEGATFWIELPAA